MSNEQEKKNTSIQLLDLRKGISPFTLLKVSNAFRQMKIEEVLEVLWSNPETLSQIKKILPRNSWEIIDIKERKEINPDHSWFKIKLKKTSMKEERKEQNQCPNV